MDDRKFDSDVRLRAFEFLDSATKTFGQVLPWKLLTEGFRYRDEPVCLIGASGIWKPKILPRMPISISTAPPHPGRSAPYDDGIDGNGQLSYRYRGEDSGHPDNVGLRDAMRSGAPLIYFFGIERGLYLPTWPVFVVGDDPKALAFRVAVDDRVLGTADENTSESAVREARRQYVTGITVRRLHQEAFRIRVLRAYRDRCAVCRLRHSELLDAAHILPDSDPRGEPIVQNGLALCKIHHAAFDRHILGVRPDLVVEIRRDVLEEIDGPMLRYGLQEMNGQRLYLPSRRDLRPAEKFVAERYAMFQGAGQR